MIAGATAGAMGAFVATPTDVVKVGMYSYVLILFHLILFYLFIYLSFIFIIILSLSELIDHN